MDKLFEEDIMALPETTMRDIESIENEDWKKATGITEAGKKLWTNSAFAPRDYSKPCKCKLVVVINGYHLWWCTTHHQPRTHCTEAKKEMEKKECTQEK